MRVSHNGHYGIDIFKCPIRFQRLTIRSRILERETSKRSIKIKCYNWRLHSFEYNSNKSFWTSCCLEFWVVFKKTKNELKRISFGIDKFHATKLSSTVTSHLLIDTTSDDAKFCDRKSTRNSYADRVPSRLTAISDNLFIIISGFN